MDHQFRFGIEEEYFLADAASGETPDGETADRFHEAAAEVVEPASHELLKGQVEVQTKPGASFDEACERLRGMRSDLARVAGDHGLSVFAAGTHPLAHSHEQETTDAERYQRLESELGLIAPRSMVCATHIHVEAPEGVDRVAVMNRLIPFMPLLYALSTSSPFWEGRDARMKGFRLAAFSEWPRMGIPEIFSDSENYERYVGLLVAAGVIEDASFIWWHIRPSTKFPTIELRVCDSCARVEDAVAIAALYQALFRCVARRPELNAGIGAVDRGICGQNIWEAQQHGVEARLIDPCGGGVSTVAERLEAALDMVKDDADALGSSDWIARTRRIVERGTSADRQIAAYRKALEEGRSEKEALLGVVKLLSRETAQAAGADDDG